MRALVVRPVTVGHEDVAVRRDEHVGRLVERVGTVAGDARLAERHQHLAVRTELVDDLALVVRRIARAVIGHPDVAVLVDVKTVREVEQPGAELPEQLARGVEVQNRIELRSDAGVGAAAVVGPDRAVGREVDAGRGSPLASVRKLAKAHARLVRIRLVVLRLITGLGSGCHWQQQSAPRRQTPTGNAFFIVDPFPQRFAGCTPPPPKLRRDRQSRMGFRPRQDPYSR